MPFHPYYGTHIPQLWKLQSINSTDIGKYICYLYSIIHNYLHTWTQITHTGRFIINVSPGI